MGRQIQRIRSRCGLAPRFRHLGSPLEAQGEVRVQQPGRPQETSCSTDVQSPCRPFATMRIERESQHIRRREPSTASQPREGGTGCLDERARLVEAAFRDQGPGHMDAGNMGIGRTDCVVPLGRLLEETPRHVLLIRYLGSTPERHEGTRSAQAVVDRLRCGLGIASKRDGSIDVPPQPRNARETAERRGDRSRTLCSTGEVESPLRQFLAHN